MGWKALGRGRISKAGKGVGKREGIIKLIKPLRFTGVFFRVALQKLAGNIASNEGNNAYCQFNNHGKLSFQIID